MGVGGNEETNSLMLMLRAAALTDATQGTCKMLTRSELLVSRSS